VILELHSADRLIRALVYQELLRRGLRPNLFAILSLIDLHEPITPTALETEAGLPSTTVRDMVNEMVDRGHVRRAENPADRRSHFLEVTDEGVRFLDEASEAVRAVERALEAEVGSPLDGWREPLRSLRRAAREALRAD
jgi:DNA-binding MarR family transcriptional regulator